MLTLTGCLGDGSVKAPAVMSDGTRWDSGWTGMGVWKSVVIVADLGKTEGFDLDLTAVMEDFLSGFHYA